MQIQVEVEDLSSVKKRLRVEIPAEAAQAEFNRVANDYRRHARLPGFRRGKAPVGLVKRHFLGDIRSEVLKNLVPPSYEQAVREKAFQPLREPDLREFDFEEGQPLKYEAEFEIRPEVKLVKYKGLKVSERARPVSEEDVSKALQELRDKQARLVAVEGRPIQDGDYVVVDLLGEYLLEDQVQSAAQPAIRDKDVVVRVGAENTHARFNQALTGMKEGQEAEFDVDYPADYPEKRLAGKSVRFQVKVTAVKEKLLPDLNDDFARDLGDYETLEALREEIRNNLEEQAEKRREADLRAALVDQLVDSTGFEVPGVLVEERIDARIHDLALNIASQGVDPTKAGLDWLRIRTELRPKAEREVRADLILAEIAAAEEIEVSAEEVEREMEQAAESSQQPIEKVRQYFQKDGRTAGLRAQIRRRKTVEFLVEHARMK